MGRPDISSFFNFEGKNILVTGAGNGIGASIALRFAEANGTVIVHYRNDETGANDTVKQIIDQGGKAIALKANLTNPEDVNHLFDECKNHIGPVDILINNAGGYPNNSFLDMTLEDWTKMYAINVETAFLCSQAAARQMIETGQGVIVNIGSIAATSPGPDHSHYNSAKAAMISMTLSSAQELAKYNIRVNAVSPGPVFREGISEAWPDGVKRWNDKAPLGRLADPVEVADTCLFFSSQASRYITGQNLLVDGGMMASSIF